MEYKVKFFFFFVFKELSCLVHAVFFPNVIPPVVTFIVIDGPKLTCHNLAEHTVGITTHS